MLSKRIYEVEVEVVRGVERESMGEKSGKW